MITKTRINHGSVIRVFSIYFHLFRPFCSEKYNPSGVSVRNHNVLQIFFFSIEKSPQPCICSSKKFFADKPLCKHALPFFDIPTFLPKMKTVPTIHVATILTHGISGLPYIPTSCICRQQICIIPKNFQQNTSSHNVHLISTFYIQSSALFFEKPAQTRRASFFSWILPLFASIWFRSFLKKMVPHVLP